MYKRREFLFMKVIPIHHPHDPLQLLTEEVVMVLGFFDGIHKGHQKVIQTGREIAKKRGLKLAVMTFNQHPAIIFQRKMPTEVTYLTNLEEKEKRMADLGVDILYIVDFTEEFSKLSPQKFVDEYIVDFHTKVAVAGFDYTYGHGTKEETSVEILPKYAKNRFEIVIVDEELLENEKISSTKIRLLMQKGDMLGVAKRLGHFYTTTGIVVHGDARGRLLGFPTANVQVDSSVYLPKNGVYAVRMKVGDIWYLGMGSIGHNDTFGSNRKLTVEINIFHFNQMIYDEKVIVEWHDYLRNQIQFENIDALVQQLNQDKNDTLHYFLKNDN